MPKRGLPMALLAPSTPMCKRLGWREPSRGRCTMRNAPNACTAPAEQMHRCQIEILVFALVWWRGAGNYDGNINTYSGGAVRAGRLRRSMPSVTSVGVTIIPLTCPQVQGRGCQKHLNSRQLDTAAVCRHCRARSHARSSALHHRSTHFWQKCEHSSSSPKECKSCLYLP